MKKKLMIVVLAAVLLFGAIAVSAADSAGNTIVLNAENEYTLPLKIHLIGDINGDSVVDAKDKKILYNHLAGLSVLTDYKFDVGDINGDGVIDAKDKKALYNHLAGLKSLWKE